MKKISLILLLAALLMLPTVSATTPASASGTFTGTGFKLINTKTAGPNTFATAAMNFSLTGAFTGTAAETATTLTTAKGLTVDVGDVRATFTGTVNGISGTVVFRINGNSAGGPFHGHFVIIDGTGGLANLRGEGTFKLTSPNGGTYSAQIHFS